MTTRRFALLLAPVLACFAAPAAAQDYDFSPAKELQKFAPLIGSWQGTGIMKDPGGEKKWAAHGTYQWSLNKHWVREDFVVSMEGDDTPIVFRSYFGWDRESKRYVSIVASNEGKVGCNEVTFLPEGTMLLMMQHHQMGIPYVERARTKVDGDTLSMRIDLMGMEGDAMNMIDGKLSRVDGGKAANLKVPGFMGAKPGKAMQQLQGAAGKYDVKGSMVMMPGQPAAGITGTDHYTPIFGGTVMHARTDGAAEGSPDAYVSQSFWAWNEHRKCVDIVSVDNMGQVVDMQAWWVDGSWVCTDATVAMGQPSTQHFVI